MDRAGRLVIAGLVVVVLAAAWWVLRESRVEGGAAAPAPAHGGAARPLSLPEGTAASAEPPRPGVAAPEPLPAPETPRTTPVFDPDDPAGLLLYGAVYDPQGRPVDRQQHWVLWKTADGNQRSALVSKGSYAFAGLSPGRGTLAFAVQGSLPFEQTLDLLATEPARRVDIRLAASLVLCVRVVDPAGQPLWETLPGDPWQRPRFGVLASPTPFAASLAPTGSRLIDGNEHATWISRLELWGDRKVEAGCEGMLDLRSPLPLWVALLNRSEVLASQRVPPEATEVVFVLSADEVLATLGSVRVAVVDARTDAPVTDARVEVHDFQTGGGGSPVDEQGVFERDGLPPGLLDLEVHAPGYESVRDVLLLGRGEHKDVGRLPLDPETTIRGRVVDEHGAPVGTTLSCARADWHRNPVGHIPRISYRSDAYGTFSIARLGRRPYMLWVLERDGGRGSDLLVVDTTAGDVEGVTLVVRPTVEVVLHSPWPAGTEHEVTMLDARGLALWRASIDGDRTWKRAYAPGEYSLVVAGAGAAVRFTVGAEPTEVTLPTP